MMSQVQGGETSLLVSTLCNHLSRASIPRFGELHADLQAIASEQATDRLPVLLAQAYKTVQMITRGKVVERIALLQGLKGLEAHLLHGQTPNFNRLSSSVIPQQVVVDASSLEGLITRFKQCFKNQSATCFIDCAPSASQWVMVLASHLQSVGIAVTFDQQELASTKNDVAVAIDRATLVLMVGTHDYPDYLDGDRVIRDVLFTRLDGGVYHLLLQGDLGRSYTAISAPKTRMWSDCRNPVLYVFQLEKVFQVVKDQLSGLAPLKPAGLKAASLNASIVHRLKKAYAAKNHLRRFMGDEVSFSDGYLVPKECTTLLKGTNLRRAVVGEPGSGKSTLLHYIAYLYGAGQAEELKESFGGLLEGCPGVVWIPLRKVFAYEPNEITLATLVSDHWFESDEVEGLEPWLASPNLLFLLDGVDEVQHLLDECTKRGRLLKRLLKRPHIIATSRSSVKETFVVQLTGLSNEQVVDFTEQYFRQKGEEELVGTFFRQVPSTMAKLLKIPLFLELTCYRWIQLKDSSDKADMSPVGLCESFLLDLCRLKAESQKVRVSFLSSKELEDLFDLPYLFEMAFEMVKKQVPFLEAKPVLARVATGERRQEIYDHLFGDETFCQRVGKNGEERQLHEFRHLIFMEYCAARYLLSHLEDLNLLVGNSPSYASSAFNTVLFLVSFLHQGEGLDKKEKIEFVLDLLGRVVRFNPFEKQPPAGSREASVIGKSAKTLDRLRKKKWLALRFTDVDFDFAYRMAMNALDLEQFVKNVDRDRKVSSQELALISALVIQNKRPIKREVFDALLGLIEERFQAKDSLLGMQHIVALADSDESLVYEAPTRNVALFRDLVRLEGTVRPYTVNLPFILRLATSDEEVNLLQFGMLNYRLRLASRAQSNKFVSIQKNKKLIRWMAKFQMD